MAQRTKGSEPVGRSKSSVAKSPVAAAASSSRPRATRARAATKSAAAGTSATTTKTAGSTRARSTPAKTAPRRPTKPLAGAGSPSKAKAPETGEHLFLVAEAVGRDLVEIAKRAPELARSSLAALALSLALSVDVPESTTSKSGCAARLLETLETLRSLVPPAEEDDAVSDLINRRAARLAGQPDAAAVERARGGNDDGARSGRARRASRAVPGPVATVRPASRARRKA